MAPGSGSVLASAECDHYQRAVRSTLQQLEKLRDNLKAASEVSAAVLDSFKACIDAASNMLRMTPGTKDWCTAASTFSSKLDGVILGHCRQLHNDHITWIDQRSGAFHALAKYTPFRQLQSPAGLDSNEDATLTAPL